MPITLIVPPEELPFPIKIGKKRQSEALRMNLEDKHGFIGDGEKVHILGACGEMVFALVIGAKWEGTVNTFRRGGDVLKYQVRTRSLHWYDLLVRDNDKPWEQFVLLTCEDDPERCVKEDTPAEFRLWGWHDGIRRGACSRWRHTHGNREEAWFVPRGALRHVRLLPGLNRPLPIFRNGSASMVATGTSPGTAGITR